MSKKVNTAIMLILLMTIFINIKEVHACSSDDGWEKCNEVEINNNLKSMDDADIQTYFDNIKPENYGLLSKEQIESNLQKISEQYYIQVPWDKGVDQSKIPIEKIQFIPPDKVDVLKIKDRSRLTSKQLKHNSNLGKLSNTKPPSLNQVNLQELAIALKELSSFNGELDLSQLQITSIYDPSSGILRNGNGEIELRSFARGIISIKAKKEGGFIIIADGNKEISYTNGRVEVKNNIFSVSQGQTSFSIDINGVSNDKAINIRSDGKTILPKGAKLVYLDDTIEAIKDDVVVEVGNGIRVTNEAKITSSIGVINVRKDGSFVKVGNAIEGRNAEAILIEDYFDGDFVKDGNEILVPNGLHIDLISGVGSKGIDVRVHKDQTFPGSLFSDKPVSREKIEELKKQAEADGKMSNGEVWIKHENGETRVYARGRVDIKFYDTSSYKPTDKFIFSSNDESGSLDMKRKHDRYDFVTKGEVYVEKGKDYEINSKKVPHFLFKYEGKQKGSLMAYTDEYGKDEIHFGCVACDASLDVGVFSKGLVVMKADGGYTTRSINIPLTFTELKEGIQIISIGSKDQNTNKNFDSSLKKLNSIAGASSIEIGDNFDLSFGSLHLEINKDGNILYGLKGMEETVFNFNLIKNGIKSEKTPIVEVSDRNMMVAEGEFEQSAAPLVKSFDDARKDREEIEKKLKVYQKPMKGTEEFDFDGNGLIDKNELENGVLRLQRMISDEQDDVFVDENRIKDLQASISFIQTKIDKIQGFEEELRHNKNDVDEGIGRMRSLYSGYIVMLEAMQRQENDPERKNFYQSRLDEIRKLSSLAGVQASLAAGRYENVISSAQGLSGDLKDEKEFYIGLAYMQMGRVNDGAKAWSKLENVNLKEKSQEMLSQIQRELLLQQANNYQEARDYYESAWREEVKKDVEDWDFFHPQDWAGMDEAQKDLLMGESDFSKYMTKGFETLAGITSVKKSDGTFYTISDIRNMKADELRHFDAEHDTHFFKENSGFTIVALRTAVMSADGGRIEDMMNGNLGGEDLARYYLRRAKEIETGPKGFSQSKKYYELAYWASSGNSKAHQEAEEKLGSILYGARVIADDELVQAVTFGLGEFGTTTLTSFGLMTGASAALKGTAAGGKILATVASAEKGLKSMKEVQSIVNSRVAAYLARDAARTSDIAKFVGEELGEEAINFATGTRFGDALGYTGGTSYLRHLGGELASQLTRRTTDAATRETRRVLSDIYRWKGVDESVADIAIGNARKKLGGSITPSNMGEFLSLLSKESETLVNVDLTDFLKQERKELTRAVDDELDLAFRTLNSRAGLPAQNGLPFRPDVVLSGAFNNHILSGFDQNGISVEQSAEGIIVRSRNGDALVIKNNQEAYSVANDGTITILPEAQREALMDNPLIKLSLEKQKKLLGAADQNYQEAEQRLVELESGHIIDGDSDNPLELVPQGVIPDEDPLGVNDLQHALITSAEFRRQDAGDELADLSFGEPLKIVSSSSDPSNIFANAETATIIHPTEADTTGDAILNDLTRKEPDITTSESGLVVIRTSEGHELILGRDGGLSYLSPASRARGDDTILPLSEELSNAILSHPMIHQRLKEIYETEINQFSERAGQLQAVIREMPPIAPKSEVKELALDGTVTSEGFKPVTIAKRGAGGGQIIGNDENGNPFYGWTDPGQNPRKKGNNEDAIGCVPGEGGLICFVADGVGGREKGEEASFRVAEELSKVGQSGKSRSVEEAISAASTRIKKETRNGGTTVSAFQIKGNGLRVSNIGDSRVIVFRKDTQGIYRLAYTTKDDSLTQDLLDDGIGLDEKLTPQNAPSGYDQFIGKRPTDVTNVITKSVGKTSSVSTNIYPIKNPQQLDPRYGYLLDTSIRPQSSIPLQEGDIAVVATDGIIDDMTGKDSETFIDIFEDAVNVNQNSPEGIGLALKNKAHENGANDNIGLMVYKHQPAQTLPPQQAELQEINKALSELQGRLANLKSLSPETPSTQNRDIAGARQFDEAVRSPAGEAGASRIGALLTTAAATGGAITLATGSYCFYAASQSVCTMSNNAPLSLSDDIGTLYVSDPNGKENPKIVTYTLNSDGTVRVQKVLDSFTNQDITSSTALGASAIAQSYEKIRQGEVLTRSDNPVTIDIESYRPSEMNALPISRIGELMQRNLNAYIKDRKVEDIDLKHLLEKAFIPEVQTFTFDVNGAKVGGTISKGQSISESINNILNRKEISTWTDWERNKNKVWIKNPGSQDWVSCTTTSKSGGPCNSITPGTKIIYSQ